MIIKFKKTDYTNPVKSYSVNKCTKYVILCTSRSGSTVLCDLLLQTRVLGQPKEYLNPEFIKTIPDLSMISTDPLVEDLESYLIHIFSHYHFGNGCNGLKLSWDNLCKLNHFYNSCKLFKRSPSHYLKKYFGDCKFILLQRLNTIDQSISFSIASQTSNWHYWDSRKSKPIFKESDIFSHAKYITKANFGLSKAVIDAKLDYINVFYEDLILDKLNVLKKITEFILNKKVSFSNNPISSIVRVNKEEKKVFTDKFINKLNLSI